MRFLIVFLLLPVFIQAQTDSIHYYLNQLKKKSLPDSTRAFFSLKLSEQYLDINPGQSLYYGKSSAELSSKSNLKHILCASQRNVASAFLNLGRADSSLLYATQSLSLAKELQNASLVYNSLGTLGNIYLEKNQLPQAKKLFDEAIELSNTDTSIPGKSHIYANMGYYYYKNLDSKKGIGILRQGELIAKKENDHSGLMDIYSCLGNLYSFLNKQDSAQKYFLTALDYFHKEKKLRKEAIINRGLANAYGRIYNQPKMEEYFSRAYSQFNSIGDNLSAINTLIQKALNYLGVLQLEKCSQTLNVVESESARFNLKPSLAHVYLARAAIFGLLGDTINARRFQKMGNEAGKEMNDPSLRKLNMMINVVRLNGKISERPGDSATKRILSILQNEMPKELVEPALQNLTMNRKLVADSSAVFARLFQSVTPEKADDVNKFVDSVIRGPIDSNLNAITNRQLLELETRYQTRAKDDSLRIQAQQLVISRQQIQKRNVVLTIIGISIVLLSVLLFFIYRSYKKERKDKARISLLKKELQHKVKNDLAILIRLAEVTTKREEGNMSVKELENRIKSIASVHEQLYNLNDISELNFKTFTEHLSAQIQQSFGTAINFLNNIDSEFRLATSNTTPLALIINELMTNSFKYAFSDTENNQISITMKNEERGICFYYHDNGPGVTNEKKGFGFKLIQGLSSQMNGVQRIWNEAGFNYELIIPS